MSPAARCAARTCRSVSLPQEDGHDRPGAPTALSRHIGLLEQNCTVCMLCVRECPDWCIEIDSHVERVPAQGPGGRPRTAHVLDRFAIDYGLCMYCGICVEACPFDALFWAPDTGYSALDLRDLVHERERLGEWMADVPAEHLPAERPELPAN